MSDFVLTDITDGIGTITLNKPAKLNAWGYTHANRIT